MTYFLKKNLLFFLESQADDALLARLSYSASLRAQESALKAANKLPMKQVARIALLFCVLVSIILYWNIVLNMYSSTRLQNTYFLLMNTNHFLMNKSNDNLNIFLENKFTKN